MADRNVTRSGLPVETQLQLIHADLDSMDSRFTQLDDRFDELGAKLDKMLYVILGGMVSIIVALVAALATAITIV